MSNVIAKLGGRKFIIALFGALAVAANSWLGISEEAVLVVGGIVATYIAGQSLADGLSGGATSTVARSKEQQ